MGIGVMLRARAVNGGEGGSSLISVAVVELRRDEGGW